MLKPCRVCKRPSRSPICDACRGAQERARPSRGERGYGGAYTRAREELRAQFRPGETQCVICRLVIHTLREWSCEHIRPLRDGGSSDLANLGHAHASCNYGWRRATPRA